MTKKVLRNISLLLVVGWCTVSAAALEIGLYGGGEGTVDLSGEAAVTSQWYAGARSDAGLRLSRAVSADNRLDVRVVHAGPAALTGVEGAAKTGLTYRQGPFTARISNDTMVYLSTAETGDFLMTDAGLRVEYGAEDYSVFLKPELEWEFADETTRDRSAGVGVSALLGDAVVGEISGRVGDSDNPRRYQRRVLGELEVDWYTPGATTVRFGAHGGLYASNDVEEVDGEELAAWTYTEAGGRIEATAQLGPSARIMLELPMSVRQYAHDFVVDGKVGDSPQLRSEFRPALALSLWPVGDRLELRPTLEGRLVRSNSPDLERFDVSGGISAHWTLR